MLKVVALGKNLPRSIISKTIFENSGRCVRFGGLHAHHSFHKMTCIDNLTTEVIQKENQKGKWKDFSFLKFITTSSASGETLYLVSFSCKKGEGERENEKWMEFLCQPRR